MNDGRDSFVYGPPGDDTWGQSTAMPPPQAAATGGGFGYEPAPMPMPQVSASWQQEPNDFSFSAQSETELTAAGSPPVGWLVGAVVLASFGALLAAVLGATPWIAFVAWAMVGPAAIGLLAAFVRSDIRQRARPIYGARSSTPVLYWSAIGVAVVGIGISAWRIAEFAGRL